MGLRITRTWFLGAVALAAGCAARGQIDVLESRLRQQEDSIAQLQNELSTSKSQLVAARRESDQLKSQLSEQTRTARVEQLSALGQVEGIALNKLLTGGLDRDGAPGDELLSAVIVPSDSQGNLVKVPGAVSLTVFDLSKPESEQRIGRWEFSPKESEKLWHSGFLGSGYIVRVPWQMAPQSANLLVHARLKTIDGRQFDTSQPIRVVPPASTGTHQSVVTAAAQQTADDGKSPSGSPRPLPKRKVVTDASWWDDSKGGSTKSE